uniref:Uncharacterized protein n=1 Tax=Anopheles coluzzii TaxID=1518534 RepID=A0A6E8WBW5_ANOCL
MFKIKIKKRIQVYLRHDRLSSSHFVSDDSSSEEETTVDLNSADCFEVFSTHYSFLTKHLRKKFLCRRKFSLTFWRRSSPPSLCYS